MKVLRWESQAAWLLGPAPADALVLGEHVPRRCCISRRRGGARDSGWDTSADLSKSHGLPSTWKDGLFFFFNLNSFFCSWRGTWMLLCYETDTHQNAKLRIDRYTPDHWLYLPNWLQRHTGKHMPFWSPMEEISKGRGFSFSFLTFNTYLPLSQTPPKIFMLTDHTKYPISDRKIMLVTQRRPLH